MVNYLAKVKGSGKEILTEDDIAEFFHFFAKEEIEYVEELTEKMEKLKS